MKKNLGLFCVSLAAQFVVLEIFFRLLGFHGTHLDFEPVEFSKELGWKLKTSYESRWEALEWSVPYRTNAVGFRDIERSTQKKNGIVRIVVLGDSQAEGWGVRSEDMWQTRLSERLPGVEVVNLGVRGYDVLQELKQFLEVGRQYDPDIVVQILNANDYGGSGSTIMGQALRYRPLYDLVDGKIRFKPSEAAPQSTVTENGALRSVKRIIYRSAFFTWLRHKLTATKRVQKFLKRSRLRRDVSEDRSVFEYDRHYFRAVEAAYAEFGQLQRQDGFKMLVFWRENENPADLNRIVQENLGRDMILLPLPDEALWKVDGHPNVLGCRLMAERMTQELVPLVNERN